MGRVLPWIGVAFALVSVGAAIRRKGFVRGSVDTALNAMPVVGTCMMSCAFWMKNTIVS